MKQQPYTPPSTSPEFAGVPDEWVQELHAYPEGTPKHVETLAALRELAFEGALEDGASRRVVTESIEPTLIPPGFSSVRQLDEPMRLPTAALKNRILPLAHQEGSIEFAVSEYVTDLGNKVMVGDLRVAMSARLKKMGPGPRDQQRLDRIFSDDIKLVGDTHRTRNTITTLSGVGYTKVPRTKLRSYYVVDHSPTDVRVPLVLRLADSDGVSQETDLCRALFGMKLRI